MNGSDFTSQVQIHQRASQFSQEQKKQNILPSLNPTDPPHIWVINPPVSIALTVINALFI